jgi:DNA-binding SARP family transcriptional activator
MLLLDAGRIVTVERLIDGLYGEKPPAGVANALQSQVSRLRAALGVPVENHLAGYRLVAERDDIDVHCFERLAARGRDALAAGEAAEAAGLLRDALALWRGPVLADVGHAPFARPQMVRLEELRGAVTEDRIEAGLRLGGHRELVGELRELVAMYPLRERLRAQLMRALCGSGRQSEALEAYGQGQSRRGARRGPGT